MALGDWINIIAMMVTILCTAISVWLFRQIDKTRKIIERKYRKLSLIDVRSSLEEVIRQGNALRISLSTGGRGQSVVVLTAPIRTALSAAISRLPPNGKEKDLRDSVLLAQQKLEIVENCPSGQRVSNNEIFIQAIHDAAGTCLMYFEAADSKET